MILTCNKENDAQNLFVYIHFFINVDLFCFVSVCCAYGLQLSGANGRMNELHRLLTAGFRHKLNKLQLCSLKRTSQNPKKTNFAV